MPPSGFRDYPLVLHQQEVGVGQKCFLSVSNRRHEGHRQLPQGLPAGEKRLLVSSALRLRFGMDRRAACSATRRLHQREFACLVSIARANAPVSSLRFAGSAYCAKAPLADGCCGKVMALGSERVRTHCRAKMRNASANDVPSSLKRDSASRFSSESIRNCMTVDFVASMKLPLVCLRRVQLYYSCRSNAIRLG